MSERDSMGRRYWRAIVEPASEPEPRGEFAPSVLEPPDVMVRRTFLKLLGMTAGLAALPGCTRGGPDKIVPFVNRPPEVTPGLAVHYATALSLDGFGRGVVVECHEGHPTKVEGNPGHPASLGATSAQEQAAIVGLYDPCRARVIRRNAEAHGWIDLAATLREAKGPVHVLLEPTSSPLVAAQLERLAKARPGSRVFFHAPLAPAAPWAASRALFGRAAAGHVDFERADALLAVDCDFLAEGPDHVRASRGFATRRDPSAGAMNRLYAIEPAPTVTGFAADHRLARRPSEIEPLLAAIAAEVVHALDGRVALPGEVRARLRQFALGEEHPDARFALACARDLVARRGRSAVLVGPRRSVAAHALGLLIDHALGAAGTAVAYTEPAIQNAGERDHGLEALAAALEEGEVETLVIAGGNPVYASPADLGIRALIAHAQRSVYLGPYENETAHACQWFVPEAHELESWGDVRAWDGTVTLQQPTIRPLTGGKTRSELLGLLLDDEKTALEWVESFWRERSGAADFGGFWRHALATGVVAGSALESVKVAPRWGELVKLLDALPAASSAPLELALVRDAAVHDGRFTNNPLLLELPDPVTKLTWDKAALVSAKTARALDVKTEDVLEVAAGGRSVEAPVFVQPGVPDGVLVLPLGYGRRGTEQLAAGLGFDAYALQTRAAPFARVDVKARKLVRPTHSMGVPPTTRTETRRLATTQRHASLEGRDIFREAPLARFEAEPGFARADEGERPALYEPPPAPEGVEQWGMTIDLSKCNGCNACVVACQAENNVPVVGKEGVLDGREMHWLRLDRYFTGPESAPEARFQPLLCQHCEKAPCEYVCPVNATTHSADGLNEQTYNRCIGTRFCSNNCPYKVRRFNWFNYTKSIPESERLALNPDVTVRQRGVMEKCTFCVQRIREAEIRAQREGRRIRDGELRTACQQSCGAGAIVFGAISDPSSEVAKRRADPRRYELLGEQGTRPRVLYLAKVTNENPALRGGGA